MASFFQDIWDSVFEPGTNPSLLIATNVTFGCLQLVLAALLYATASIHFVVLSGLCGGLWWAINWFAREMKVHQAEEVRKKEEKERQEKEKRRRSRGPSAGAEDSETEVEPIARVKTGATLGSQEARSAAVEVVEEKGDLSHRGLDRGLTPQPSPGGSKSSVSTEDEWERVSENEKDK